MLAAASPLAVKTLIDIMRGGDDALKVRAAVAILERTQPERVEISLSDAELAAEVRRRLDEQPSGIDGAAPAN